MARLPALLVSGLALFALGFWLTKPISQPLEYHNFADKRSFLSVPNFFDVMSNLPFFVVSIWGVLRLLERSKRLKRSENDRQAAALFYFVSVGLVALGSGYYHWRPCNDTLVWDRLPMSLAFMALLYHVLTNVVVEFKFVYFIVMEIVGISSVVIWALFDDLRLYGLVQFGSIAACLVLLIGWHKKISRSGFLWGTVILYVAAKLTETFDRDIFVLLAGGLSGHSIKHLLAAGATYYSGLYILGPVASFAHGA